MLPPTKGARRRLSPGDHLFSKPGAIPSSPDLFSQVAASTRVGANSAFDCPRRDSWGCSKTRDPGAFLLNDAGSFRLTVKMAWLGAGSVFQASSSPKSWPHHAEKSGQPFLPAGPVRCRLSGNVAANPSVGGMAPVTLSELLAFRRLEMSAENRLALFAWSCLKGGDAPSPFTAKFAPSPLHLLAVMSLRLPPSVRERLPPPRARLLPNRSGCAWRQAHLST